MNNKALRMVAILIISCWFLASCGDKKDLGANLGLLVLPAEVIIGPAAIRTCLDIVNGSATASGSAPVAVFPKMRLDWSHPKNSLILSVLRVTFTGPGIKDGKYVMQIAGDELAALFGGSVLPPNKFVDIQHSTETDPRGHIRGSAPCQLTLGSIPLANGAATGSFKAKIRFEIIATSISDNYLEQEFVKQEAQATASYIKY